MVTDDVRRSSCVRADSVMDSHSYGTLSTELLTDYHHSSIIKLSVCCIYGKSGKDKDNDSRLPCLYIGTGWGVMTCVCNSIL